MPEGRFLWSGLCPDDGGLLALMIRWDLIVSLNRLDPSCRHLSFDGGFYLFPFVLFIYFPSTFWSDPPPGAGERRRVEDEI